MQSKIQVRSLALLIVAWLIGGDAAGAAGFLKQAPHTLPEYSRRYTERALAPILQPGKVFYVATDGNDANPGTKASPLGSLAAARDAIRRLKQTPGLPEGGVHVVLLAGQYPLDRSFRLSAEDSGTAACPIVYRGIGTDQVTLTGGVSLDTERFSVVWSRSLLSRLPEPARGQVMSIDLSKDDVTSYFSGEGRYGQISMDGHLLQLAQWPNRGYHHIGEILDAGPTTRWLKPGEQPVSYSKDHPTGGKFTFREKLSPAVQTEFERTGDMRAQGYFHNDWYFQDEPIGKIDGEVIQLLRYTHYGIVEKMKSMPRRVRLVNVLAELGEPGQWYFDRNDQRLYVWPIDGFVPGTSRVTVLGGEPLLRLQDTAYVTFRDVTLENTGDLSVEVSGGEHNLLAGCVVRNGVGRGVNISGGRYNGITGCNFYGLHTALSLSGGNMRTLVPCYHFATNNMIHDCRPRGYGLIGLSGVGLHFAHNLLYNLNGAINFRTVNLLLEYNEFYHIGYEMGDFNVAYCGAQWYTMNNVIRHNFVHHLLEPGGYAVVPEFAVSSVPDVASLRKFIPPDELWPPGPSWGYHWADLDVLRALNYQLLGDQSTGSLEQFVAATQMGQGEIFQWGIERMRRRKPKSSAISICHFITYAPDMKWGIVDYFQTPKRSYYYVKRACQPLLVSLQCDKRRWLPGETFKTALWIVNDLHKEFNDCSLSVEIRGEQGTPVARRTFAVGQVLPDSSASVEVFKWEVQGKLGGTFRVAATLQSADGRTLSANHQVLLIADQEKARKQCQALAGQLWAVKAGFPTADYYRFFPELSGPERSKHFGDAAPQATGFQRRQPEREH